MKKINRSRDFYLRKYGICIGETYSPLWNNIFIGFRFLSGFRKKDEGMDNAYNNPIFTVEMDSPEYGSIKHIDQDK